MDILLSGYCGHMGSEVRALAARGYRGARIVAGVDPGAAGEDPLCASGFEGVTADADCIIDFSHHTATPELVGYALRRGMPLVIATTGQTESELDTIKSAAESIPVFLSANFSMGIAVLTELVRTAAAAFPEADIEIIEKHHNRKKDAPSGTALALAEAVKESRNGSVLRFGRSGNCPRSADEIGIHSLRMGNVTGEHEVIICTENQTLSLKHEAHSRALFAEGAICAAEFLCGKTPGLYRMRDIF